MVELCDMRGGFFCLILLICTFPAFGQSLPEDWICKEHGRIEHQLQRRSNSGVKHGYLIDYNRCKWWVNPRRNAYLKGDVMAHFTIVNNTDSVGFDLTASLTVDDVYSKNGSLNYRRAGNFLYAYKPCGWKAGE